jgi:hypothetical protein
VTPAAGPLARARRLPLLAALALVLGGAALPASADAVALPLVFNCGISAHGADALVSGSTARSVVFVTRS